MYILVLRYKYQDTRLGHEFHASVFLSVDSYRLMRLGTNNLMLYKNLFLRSNTQNSAKISMKAMMVKNGN